MPATDEPRTVVRRIVDAAGSGVVRIGRHGGRGCGFVVDDGIVVTNAHNLRDRTTEVGFADGRAVQARALGVDVDGDLAVLEVDTAGARPLAWAGSPAELGDVVHAVARTGDGVRVTSGAVSGVGRTFRGPRGRRITQGVEHTALLARGTSGSPIVDADGAVLGISTLRLGDGFTIALPSGDELRRQVERLRAGEVPSRRVLGIALAPAPVTRRLRRAVGLADRDGVLVRVVEDGSPADRAGVRSGDLLTRIGDVEVASVDDVAAALEGLGDGGTTRLHVVRGTDELDLDVAFDEPAAEGGGSTGS
jgi:S1-C subfamily serine protease